MVMPGPDKRRFLFGDHELDVARGTLTRQGVVIALRPKSFRVLQYLVERRGCLVTRDELLNVAWRGRIVTDGTVAKCMADIRAALDDHSHAIVRTVHGRGYRFEAPVEEVGQPETEHVAVATLADAPVLPMPAVARLVRERRVAKSIVVIGTLAAATAACAVLLAPRWDAGLAAGPAAAANAPVVTCRSASATTVAGCDAVRSARFFIARRESGDLERAERDFRRASDVNPALSDAWAGLASVYSVQLASLGHAVPPPQLVAQRLEAIRKALETNPRSPEALARYSQHLSCLGRKEEARQVLERALAFGPDEPVPLSIAAGEAMAAGHLDEAIALQARAAAAGPISSLHYNNLSEYLILAGRYAEARESLKKMAELGLHRGDVASELTRLLVLERRYEEAVGPLEQWHEDGDRDVLLAITYTSLGRRAEADAVMARLEKSREPRDALRMGEIYAQLGDFERARHWVEEAERRWAATSPSARAMTADAVSVSPFLAPVRELLLAAAPDRNG